MKTLLQLVTAAIGEMGLQTQSSVITSTDKTTMQVLALINGLGQTLLTEAENGWQFLAKEHRFSTVYYTYTGTITAGSTTISALSSTVGLTTDFMVSGAGVMADTFIDSVGSGTAEMSNPASTSGTVSITFGQAKYDMPADYNLMTNKTQFNKTSRWTIIGPKDPQEWQWLKSSYIQAGPRQRYRIYGNQFVIYPMPVASHVVGFEYQSNAWVVGADGTAKTEFTVDSDTCLFPDRLMIQGAKMAFKQAKGLDASAEAVFFNNELSKLKGQTAGADTLSLAPKRNSLLITTANLPDTGYGPPV